MQRRPKPPTLTEIEVTTRLRELLEASGFVEVFSARDLFGIERVSGGQYAGASTQAIR